MFIQQKKGKKAYKNADGKRLQTEIHKTKKTAENGLLLLKSF